MHQGLYGLTGYPVPIGDTNEGPQVPLYFRAKGGFKAALKQSSESAFDG
jgi:hypothetical protein